MLIARFFTIMCSTENIPAHPRNKAFEIYVPIARQNNGNVFKDSLSQITNYRIIRDPLLCDLWSVNSWFVTRYFVIQSQGKLSCPLICPPLCYNFRAHYLYLRYKYSSSFAKHPYTWSPHPSVFVFNRARQTYWRYILVATFQWPLNTISSSSKIPHHKLFR